MSINHLEEAYGQITSHSRITGRLGLQDLIVFDLLMGMYESEMGDLDPSSLWTASPDEVMQSIIDSNKTFTVDYGWEDLIDSLRDYMTQNKFIVDSDDLTEEEYKQLVERTK